MMPPPHSIATEIVSRDLLLYPSFPAPPPSPFSHLSVPKLSQHLRAQAGSPSTLQKNMVLQKRKRKKNTVRHILARLQKFFNRAPKTPILISAVKFGKRMDDITSTPA